MVESLKRSPIQAAPVTGRGGDLHISEIEPWPGSPRHPRTTLPEIMQADRAKPGAHRTPHRDANLG